MLNQQVTCVTAGVESSAEVQGGLLEGQAVPQLLRHEGQHAVHTGLLCNPSGASCCWCTLHTMLRSQPAAGMPKHKEWALYAPEGDVGLLRNAIAHNLWQRMGRSLCVCVGGGGVTPMTGCHGAGCCLLEPLATHAEQLS
jgi:hypothetical protein